MNEQFAFAKLVLVFNCIIMPSIAQSSSQLGASDPPFGAPAGALLDHLNATNSLKLPARPKFGPRFVPYSADKRSSK